MKSTDMLIEKGLQVATIGAESMRERGASSALPPLYFLHVWWARRPLTASRAAILASVVPSWEAGWPEHLIRRFPTEETYRQWFLQLCGIFGDPVAGRKLIQWAKDRNIRLKTPPYSHKRAFTVNPTADYLEVLGDLLEHAWGKRTLTVLDSFSGGGSIPFEARRYGFDTIANELNPVASVILKATIDYPFRFGPKLADDIRTYGAILAERVRKRLSPFFPVEPGESVHAYIWARTVACPYTGKPIPLSPNWWLRKEKAGEPAALQVSFPRDADVARFAVLRGSATKRADPDQGTVKRGNAISPWAGNQPVDGSYIKAEAQAGRMGQQLCGLVLKTSSGVVFRGPSVDDLRAAQAASHEYQMRGNSWRVQGLIPSEVVPDGNKTSEALRYGASEWSSLFAPRQLLTLCTYLDEYLVLREQIRSDLTPERAEAIEVYLAFALDKGADYNSRLCKWDSTRNKITNTFDRHDYSFKWSHAEFDGAHNLFPWTIGQVADAYAGISGLAATRSALPGAAASAGKLTLTQGSAGSLSHLPDRSVDLVCVDPPYEANVMYAECADFFYVWMKRTLGDRFPELFADELTNKDDEAVANVARFAAMKRKRTELALADYERKMAASFREMHRVLTDDGVLTVMFTHKKVEAWDSLATSLIGAGFSIKSSWPVHTESEHSTHQAKKNAAQSTIFLTCRKRTPRDEPVWWDDLKGKVRRTARETAAALEQQSIRGVDLYIATFGPTLAILSENWPVLTSEVDERGNPRLLRPEVALDVARTEVVALRKQNLLLGRTVQFDRATDWYLMAWDAFGAVEFPADEARKLALALDIDLEQDVIAQSRLVTKKQSSVMIQEPAARRRRGMVDPDQTHFDRWLDAAHTAMLLYSEDGAAACKRFLERAGLLMDGTFRALLQALINTIPRTRIKGKFARPEAECLDALRLAFFDDLVVPAEAEPLVQQGSALLPFREVDEGNQEVDGDSEGDDTDDEE